MPIPQCPDCCCDMEEGFIPEYTSGSLWQTVWHSGPPENQRFFGLKTSNLHVDLERARKIIAYRCPQCGLVRSYAP